MDNKLTPTIAGQLRKIEVIHWMEIPLYPCAAELVDGASEECVYFVEADRIDDLLAKTGAPGRFIDAVNVSRIRPSEKRLPARFARQLYLIGESGMGYYDFIVSFGWVWRKRYVIGDILIDFINYPFLLGPFWVTGAHHTMGRVRRKKWGKKNQSPSIKWCAFSWPEAD